MRALACAAAVVACALAASGCASSYAASRQSSTDAIQLHEFGYDQLSPPLRAFVRTTIAESGPPDGSATEIDVYGPGSLHSLVKAASGDDVFERPSQRKKPFYLIVLHGHFSCGTCPLPRGAKEPEGTIETYVWSHGSAAGEYGVTNKLRAPVYLLNRLALIQLS